MIELDRALEIVSLAEPRVTVETVSLAQALGRVLAQEIASPIDSPPFDKSAMDGFAVGAEDDSEEFRVLETVAAGGTPTREVRRGECARIMTGAMLPPGTGRVIRKELVEEKAGTVRPVRREQSDNVIRRGENLRAGETILGPRVIAPRDIGILAASGVATVPVAVPPLAGIVSTGSEIRPPGEPLGPGEIYNSNGPQLAAQLSALRCPSRFCGTAADEPGALAAAVSEALAGCDLVLLTGGVSEGDFDYVPQCLSDLGAEILFHGVAIKPGKPTLFARRGDKYLFGLPGNPVSSFVVFEVLVKPFLYRRMGFEWTPSMQRGTLAERISRRSTERTEFLPVRLREGRVWPVGYHGSAHVNALGDADGLVRVEKGVGAVEKGTVIDVRPL